jgi:hypothetical protein
VQSHLLFVILKKTEVMKAGELSRLFMVAEGKKRKKPIDIGAGREPT